MADIAKLRKDDRVVVAVKDENGNISQAKARVRSLDNGLVGYSFAKDGDVSFANPSEVYPLYRYTWHRGSLTHLAGQDAPYGTDSAPVPSTSRQSVPSASAETDSEDEDSEDSED